ncbi:TIR domain-containing protein [Candidatus Dojkabacteria bacterium]|nr:TIR domain-containing protein [Candidatus Dojkabacteria bacterium]
MADVFISYSRKDIAFASLLQSGLEKKAIDTWIDWEDIPPTQDWLKEVYKAIEESNAFLFIISEASLNSDICKLEITHAVDNNKRLVPIVLSDTDIQKIPKLLASKQWISFPENEGDEFQETFDKLVNAIYTDWEWIKKHTQLQVLALEWSRNGKNKSYLISGSRLKNAENWLGNNPSKEISATTEQIEFIQTSRSIENQRQRAILFSILFVLIISIGLTIYSIVQRNQAQKAEELARIRELTAQSQIFRKDDIFYSAIIGIETYQRNKILDTYSNLINLYLSSANISRIFWGHDQQVNCVQFSPNGRFLASASNDGKIILWDNNSSEMKGIPLTSQSKPILSLAFSPDSTNLVAGDADGSIAVWDVNNREIIQTVNIKNEGLVYIEEIIFDPDGKFIAVRSWDANDILFLDAKNLKIVHKLSIDTNVTSIAINPNGRIFAAGGGNGNLYLWTNDIGEDLHPMDFSRIVEPIEVSSYEITDLVFNSLDGTLAVSSLGFPTLSLFDVNNDFHSPLLIGDGSPINRLALNYSGNLLAAAANDGTITLYNTNTYQPYSKSWKASPNTITSIVFFPLGDLLSTAGLDNSFIIWTFWPPNPGRDFFVRNYSNRALYVPRSGLLLTGDLNGNVSVYEKSSLINIYIKEGHTEAITSMAINLNGDRLVTAGFDSMIYIWETNPLEKLYRIKIDLPVNEYLMSIAISPDSRYIAYILSNGMFSLWDNKEESMLVENILPNDIEVFDLEFSPNGEILALGGQDGVLSLFDVTKLKIIKTSIKAHNKGINNVTFSQSGSVIITGSRDGIINTWITDGLELYYTLSRRSRGEIEDISLLKDTTIIAIADQFGVELWDLNKDRSVAELWDSPEDYSISVDFDASGDYLVAVNKSGSVVEWKLDYQELIDSLCNLVGRNFTQEEWNLFFWDREYNQTCSNW